MTLLKAENSLNGNTRAGNVYSSQTLNPQSLFELVLDEVCSVTSPRSTFLHGTLILNLLCKHNSFEYLKKKNGSLQY